MGDGERKKQGKGEEEKRFEKDRGTGTVHGEEESGYEERKEMRRGGEKRKWMSGKKERGRECGEDELERRKELYMRSKEIKKNMREKEETKSIKNNRREKEKLN